MTESLRREKISNDKGRIFPYTLKQAWATLLWRKSFIKSLKRQSLLHLRVHHVSPLQSYYRRLGGSMQAGVCNVWTDFPQGKFFPIFFYKTNSNQYYFR